MKRSARRGRRDPGPRGSLRGLVLVAVALAGCGDRAPGGGAGDGGAGDLAAVPYPIVDTAQTACYGVTAAIACPAPGAAFFGQDAQQRGLPPTYTVAADGLTVRDEVTGLIWQRSPETNGDGVLGAADKLTYAAAEARCAALAAAGYAGYDDWRLPSIKELYSLIRFDGTDPSGLSGTDTSALTPFIDRGAFQFAYGDPAAGERIIDAQYASSTLYVSPTWMPGAQLFGVNFADGRIKGYGLERPGGGEMVFFVQCVRGNPRYGVNDFVDNGDGTVTDRATGLTWAQDDSGEALEWEAALAWVAARNAAGYLGHDDWRLPNAKELQSIVDYTRSPDATGSAAIAPIFHATELVNEGGEVDYPWYWASTTHAGFNGLGAGVYLAFGRAGGWQPASATGSCYALQDVHGAGAQRSDPKTTAGRLVMGQACGDGTAYGNGPQGDVQRGRNHVRLVRGGAVTVASAGGSDVDAGAPPDGPALGDGGVAADGPVGPASCVVPADCEVAGACPSLLGCACTATPDGSRCVPRCATSPDCPQPPGQTLVCGPDGLCVPG